MNAQQRNLHPEDHVETEMVMQRVAPAPNASHELIRTSVVNRDAACASISKIGRVSLARFAWFVVAYNVAVIVWGAYVRATGSGAGCGSHWPLCNGEFLPTTPQTQTVIEFSHRVTSGVSLVLVAILLIWCWRSTAKGDWPRYSAVAAAVLLFNEALLGALLVLVDHVGNFDRSAAHAFFLCLHFGNTLLLLAALALTARWLSNSDRRFGVVRASHHAIATGFGLVSAMVTGMTGSLASLGDTLFPADSLRHAALQDFSSNSHILLRLRVLHPIAAVIGSTYVLWLIHTFWRKQERFAWAPLLTITLAGQIALGALNVILLDPVWLQMMHLLVAEIFWTMLVLASADQLFARHILDVPLSRKKSTTVWSLAIKTTDYVSRHGGPSS
ncbi:MAG TPA: COX15/CtaA family protein [Candidatus Acidoferrum sp.]|nr:COX15/CtaA family protein [Candidatus Acidoferrum sp.]